MAEPRCVPPSRHGLGRGVAGLLWLALGCVPAAASVQAPGPSTLPKPVLAQLSGSAATSAPQKVAAQVKSGWVALSPAQQQSLAPLAGTWDSLSAAHQRKWLALSENFSRLSPAEQQILHSRMRDWAALSTRQRAQARLNFGEAKQLSSQDKKAMWEATRRCRRKKRRSWPPARRPSLPPRPPR